MSANVLKTNWNTDFMYHSASQDSSSLIHTKYKAEEGVTMGLM